MKKKKNKYEDEVVKLVRALLKEAELDNTQIDKIIKKYTDGVIKDLSDLLDKLYDEGYLDDEYKPMARKYPETYFKIKEAEERVSQGLEIVALAMLAIMETSLTRTYRKSFRSNYIMMGRAQELKTNPKPQIVITDTYIKEHVLKVPWLKDGKTYSDRLYGNVANFRSKLNYILEQGIKNGKGKQWMIDSWRQLTHATVSSATRLIQTETMAMWSLATKESYLEMGVEYVEIVGDALCGTICVDFVGEAIPLREAELGMDLPPYHPYCACSYVVYTDASEEGVVYED